MPKSLAWTQQQVDSM